MPSAWKQGLEHHRSSPERWMSKPRQWKTVIDETGIKME